MKKVTSFVAAGALLTMCAMPAYAQTTAAGPQSPATQTAPGQATPQSASPSAAELSAGMTMLSQIVQMQRQARTAMLSALSPAHRDALAKIVGDLALASEPNFDAAAARLDASLSPAEIQAIGRIRAAMRAQAMIDAGQLRSTLQTTLSPEQARQIAADSESAMRATRANARIAPAIAKIAATENDPGHILLQTVLFGLQPFTRIFSDAIAPNGVRQ